MSLSYSSFKIDLESFNCEEYIHPSNSEFLLFLDNYKDIENEDFKKPIFSQTSKFKKIPNNYKNYKYLKITRDDDDIEEKKDVWIFENPKEENEKIAILIKTYLNKISEDTYKKISSDFLNELILIKNINLFEILCKEILNKCLFDTKYRNLYVNLCYKIWNNKQIHYNLIEIMIKDNSYFWKDINEVNINGPFNNENEAKNNAYIKMNFKKYFLNYIQKLYLEKDYHFENLTDDEIFMKKKKILLLVELIGIIYIEKYINFDIINIIIIDLLHLNNNFKNIEDLEYEILYILIKLIKENRKPYNGEFAEYKLLFEDFINSIKNIISTTLSKRSSFFLENIIIYLESFSEDINILHKNNFDNEVLKKNFFQILESGKGDLLSIYKNINDDEHENIVYSCIDNFICKKGHNKDIIRFLNLIKNGNLIYNILKKMIENIEDIMLDIPNANEKIIYLIKNIDYDHNFKKIFIEKMENINDDSDGSYEMI